MRAFLQLVIAGAATGAIYSLIAAGLARRDRTPQTFAPDSASS